MVLPGKGHQSVLLEFKNVDLRVVAALTLPVMRAAQIHTCDAQGFWYEQ